MKDFISYEGFKISYDKKMIRAVRKDDHGFVEFSMADPEELIRGENVQLWEIDKLYDLLKSNYEIMQASLRGTWVEMDEPPVG